MFRARDPQESLWQSQFLVTPKKAKRLEGSWAEVFRNEALPLIDEELFAPMYCADNGRPNRAVQTVLGVHLLKEMFNLTDGEALEQLEFNLLWHHALRLDIEETHLPQKTLHNFRVRLMQVAETCHEENATQLITHVEVTPSSGSDTDVSVPVVDGLAERKVRPDELFVDTAYGSGRNAFEASRRGTELVSPVAGSAPGNSHEGERDGPPPLTAADFQIDVTGEQATVCPAGHPSIEEHELEDAPERVEVHFARTTCEPCPLRSRCPVKLDRRAGDYVLKADLVKVNIERRRRAEATEEWRKRYAIRAGIEGTNSELKRAHGLGRLRVRGGRRVRLAVYLKTLACNFKRMVHARLVEMENTAQRAVGTVPAVAAA